MIEAWGRGFDKIRDACARYDSAPLPVYYISESGVMVLCKPCEKYMILLHGGDSTDSNGRKWSKMVDNLTESEMEKMQAILEYLLERESISSAKGRELTGKSATTVKRYLRRLCEANILEPYGVTSDKLYKKKAENGRT